MDMKNTLDMRANWFLVRAKANPKLILTVSGAFIPEALLGPGGYCAKLYKTRRGAELAGSNVTVHPCTERGVEAEVAARLVTAAVACPTCTAAAGTKCYFDAFERLGSNGEMLSRDGDIHHARAAAYGRNSSSDG